MAPGQNGDRWKTWLQLVVVVLQLLIALFLNDIRITTRDHEARIDAIEKASETYWTRSDHSAYASAWRSEIKTDLKEINASITLVRIEIEKLRNGK